MGLRTFLAIDLPSSLQAAIGQNIRTVKRELPGISWSKPENLHINLKFLGETTEGQVDQIRHAVESAISHVSPFELELKGFGVFPDHRSPRVLWVGLGGALDSLTMLAGCIGNAVVPLGFPQEGRPFRPHLTVARVKRDHREVGRVLGTLGLLSAPFSCGPILVERVTLFKSDLRQTGPIYTKLWDVSLQA
ncbi:MAG: RNA 2',3'-cyclic phosphodiesterase [Nitrospira sp. SB0672_bin_25]|nr:RNA 2',3'-cyclic phosphodiesterase [Nitrospira sp. SB0666_bin_27]MYF24561.1 RNA 2',3'-cyclic phosphodiesterase [Nitrospira sp. SB0678_bin_10]MYJ53364.1 RNA 2',3'-cyclic phosphodiesterase [Nitrospira sp. SB0672_bin_25]